MPVDDDDAELDETIAIVGASVGVSPELPVEPASIWLTDDDRGQGIRTELYEDQHGELTVTLSRTPAETTFEVPITVSGVRWHLRGGLQRRSDSR